MDRHRLAAHRYLRLHRLAPIVVILVSLAGPPAQGASPDAAPAGRDVREILVREGCQISLPGSEQAAVTSAERRIAPAAESWSWPVSGPRRVEPSAGGSGFAKPFFIVLLIIVACAGLVLLLFVLKKRDRDSVQAVAREPRKATRLVSARRKSAGRDTLASEGRFNEAVHALLLRAFKKLAARGLLTLKVSMTSRELLAQQSVPAAITSPLRSLAGVVEASMFGGHTLDRGDYDHALACYSSIAQALRSS